VNVATTGAEETPAVTPTARGEALSAGSETVAPPTKLPLCALSLPETDTVTGRVPPSSYVWLPETRPEHVLPNANSLIEPGLDDPSPQATVAVWTAQKQDVVPSTPLGIQNELESVKSPTCWSESAWPSLAVNVVP
jgi:hypothetical protein